MTKDDWDELLAHITKLLVQKAEEEVEGEFPSPQEIRDKLSEFKSDITYQDDLITDVKNSLIEYVRKRVREH